MYHVWLNKGRFLLVLGAISMFAISATASSGEPVDCPCVSEDCAYGAIDDCFDDLDPYGLPPPIGGAPGAPVRPRPPVATGHVTLDQVARAVRYTISLTEEGIQRYRRITHVEDVFANVQFWSGERHLVRATDSWLRNGGYVATTQFRVATDGLSATAEMPFRGPIPLTAEIAMHGVYVEVRIATWLGSRLFEGVSVVGEATGPTARPLRARRGWARSIEQDLEP